MAVVETLEICLKANIGNVATQLSGISTQLRSLGAEATAAGAQLGQGFANGISSKYGAVMAAANRLANAAVSRIRSALSIHSPSKVTYALGEYFGDGFLEGISASISAAERSAAQMSGAAAGMLRIGTDAELDVGGMKETMRSALGEALGGTNLNVTLEVDGMRLGEASIRGINRVTRSAGRVLLEI